jgi:hypothetical protein
MNKLDYSHWSTKDLLKELSFYFDLIYCEYPNYQEIDLVCFEAIEKELERRSVNWASEAKIKFHEVEE